MQISAPQMKQMIGPAIEINGFQILRVIIYFYIVVKILEIFLDHTRKESVKERLGKRFQMAYASVVGSLTKQEILDLQNTLKNTQLNVEVKAQAVTEKKKKQTKRISIDEKSNQYYDHVEMKFEEDKPTEATQDLKEVEENKQEVKEIKDNHKTQELDVTKKLVQAKKDNEELVDSKQNDDQQKPLISKERDQESKREEQKQNIANLDEIYTTD